MKRSISARTIGALGVAAVLLLTGACSNGSDDAKDDSKKDETSEGTDATEQTEDTALSDDEFVGQIDALTQSIDDADGDLCAIVEVGRQDGPESSPTTPAQVESLIQAQASMLKALAAVEPVDETNGPILTGYADKLLAAGEAAGFSVEFLSSEEFTALGSDAALSPAIAAYQTRAQTECPQPEAPAGEGGAATGPSTTVAP